MEIGGVVRDLVRRLGEVEISIVGGLTSESERGESVNN